MYSILESTVLDYILYVQHNSLISDEIPNGLGPFKIPMSLLCVVLFSFDIEAQHSVKCEHMYLKKISISAIKNNYRQEREERHWDVEVKKVRNTKKPHMC